jgi:molybdopterin-containing oxidoreductase family iron-sulfur binding subunit
MMKEQTNNKQVELAEIRARLANAHGQHYWRSLDELAETEEFQQFVQNEFPHGLMNWENPVSRRTFLKLMGASMALAGLTACGPLQPVERIVPYVDGRPELVPGEPMFFATTMPSNGYGIGLVVRSFEGRPTKVEGNEAHPASLGATSLIAQAAVLTMYDPDRSQVVRHASDASTWEAFVEAITPAMQGKGVRILTETVTSPTLANQLQNLQESDGVEWHQYDPMGRDNARAGAQLAFGEYVDTHYQFDKAEVILTLDADFLEYGPAQMVYSRHFTDKRRIREDQTDMNRLYVVESTPTITGSMADHRLPLRSSDIEDFARAVAKGLGMDVDGDIADVAPAEWVDAVVEDLKAHEGASIVMVGEGQPPEVHALVHAINNVLGNIGQTVVYTDPVEAAPTDQLASLQALVSDMQDGEVETLIIIGGNPVYTAPADLNFAEALARVNLSVHLSLYDDETSEHCTWHLPEAHFLEAWGDARAFDGTASIIQPLIAPLYCGKSACELLAALTGDGEASGYDIVRAYWSEQRPNLSERAWEEMLQEGVIANSGLPARETTLTSRSFPRSAARSNGDEMEIVFRLDPTVLDGSYANNGWLQETPKPLTKITWDNAALMSPKTAQKLGLNSQDVISITYQGATVEAPVWVTPGHANDSVTVHLGYGRTRAGHIGTGIGFNAYTLRQSDTLWFGTGAKIREVGGTHRLASTQNHHSIDVKHPKLQELTDERTPSIIHAGTIQQFREDPASVHGHNGHGHEEDEQPSLYPEIENTWQGDYSWIDDEGNWRGARWGMVIDLTVCTSCNACVTACQAENNIPVVGKEEVLTGREMHWIRIDRYYEGYNIDNPRVYHQPLGCVHCEVAPCEPVCPVAATTHSLEGLNEMVYNRCVGTRYCGNNCPYKVRRFNYYQYSDLTTESYKLMRNPDVTVRNRGVMEKCTYCVQRINLTRIAYKRDTGQSGYVEYEDGAVVPACAQACPTQAITFGDIGDPESRVAQLKAQPHNYDLLGDLAVVPRTSYLARLSNPNPALESPTATEHGGHQDSHGEE